MKGSLGSGGFQYQQVRLIPRRNKRKTVVSAVSIVFSHLMSKLYNRRPAVTQKTGVSDDIFLTTANTSPCSR